MAIFNGTDLVLKLQAAQGAADTDERIASNKAKIAQAQQAADARKQEWEAKRKARADAAQAAKDVLEARTFNDIKRQANKLLREWHL